MKKVMLVVFLFVVVAMSAPAFALPIRGEVTHDSGAIIFWKSLLTWQNSQDALNMALENNGTTRLQVMAWREGASRFVQAGTSRGAVSYYKADSSFMSASIGLFGSEQQVYDLIYRNTNEARHVDLFTPGATGYLGRYGDTVALGWRRNGEQLADSIYVRGWESVDGIGVEGTLNGYWLNGVRSAGYTALEYRRIADSKLVVSYLDESSPDGVTRNARLETGFGSATYFKSKPAFESAWITAGGKNGQAYSLDYHDVLGHQSVDLGGPQVNGYMDRRDKEMSLSLWGTDTGNHLAAWQNAVESGISGTANGYVFNGQSAQGLLSAEYRTLADGKLMASWVNDSSWPGVNTGHALVSNNAVDYSLSSTDGYILAHPLDNYYAEQGLGYHKYSSDRWLASYWSPRVTGSLVQYQDQFGLELWDTDGVTPLLWVNKTANGGQGGWRDFQYDYTYGQYSLSGSIVDGRDTYRAAWSRSPAGVEEVSWSGAGHDLQLSAGVEVTPLAAMVNGSSRYVRGTVDDLAVDYSFLRGDKFWAMNGSLSEVSGGKVISLVDIRQDTRYQAQYLDGVVSLKDHRAELDWYEQPGAQRLHTRYEGPDLRLSLDYDRQVSNSFYIESLGGTWKRTGKGERIFQYQSYDIADVGKNKSFVWIGPDRTVSLDNDQINDILELNADSIIETLKGPFGVDLNYSQSWGGNDQNFVRFDEPSRLLTAAVEGNLLEARLGANGYLDLSSADALWHVRFGAPSHNKLPIEQFVYTDDILRLDLNDTYLSYNVDARELGLFSSDAYLVKVITAPLSEMKDSAEQAVRQAVNERSFPKEQQKQLVADNVREVRLNARELAKGRLTFTDPAWSQLMTSVAYDVGEVKMSGQDLANILYSDDPRNQAYIFLQAAAAPQGGIDQVLTNRQRALSYQLATSILEPVNGAQAPGMGVTSLTGQPLSFDTMMAPIPFTSGGMLLGCDKGWVDLSTPVTGNSGRTVLSLSAVAERYYVRGGDDLGSVGDASLSTEALVYAYRFPQGTTLRLQDGLRKQFKADPFARDQIAFDTNLTPDGYASEDPGIVLPGAMAGVALKAPEDKWYVSARVMPYMPLGVDDGLKIKLGNSGTASGASAATALAMATDLRGGVKSALWGHETKLDLGRDITDELFAAPSFEVNKMLTLGVTYSGPTAGAWHTTRYNSLVKALGVESNLFYEKDLWALTDLVGASIDKKIGDDIYNLSFGETSWDNAGAREVVERYISVGMDVNSRLKLVNAVAVNQITSATSFSVLSQLALDKAGTRSLGLETSVENNAGATALDVLLRARIQY
ncbi:MAG: hypothetical protein HQL20_08935 [Candidatus Omnitrophica bacterium]|nr:hypothetical protein [Candidatus Omnitrophota bacterium]